MAGAQPFFLFFLSLHLLTSNPNRTAADDTLFEEFDVWSGDVFDARGIKSNTLAFQTGACCCLKYQGNAGKPWMFWSTGYWRLRRKNVEFKKLGGGNEDWNGDDRNSDTGEIKQIAVSSSDCETGVVY